MRALLLWCALGAGLIGFKAYIDRTAAKYPDIAVNAAGVTYFIPRAYANDGGWRGDMKRIAGCWDAREAGILPLAGPADCNAPRALHLKLRRGATEGEAPTSAATREVTFWTGYAPPAEHFAMLTGAWTGKGQWQGRAAAMRGDWQLVLVASSASPWTFLLSAQPASGSPAELERLYAGRCYRPEPLSDAGMTCDLVLRLDGGSALEYSLGPDEIMNFVPIRDALRTEAAAWRRSR